MISKTELEHAARLLKEGQLVAIPTETVYGLAANALNAEAVARIYEVKGRPASSPLIVHVASVEMARGLARDWPDAAEALAARFWPGPLTLVVEKTAAVPGIVTAGLGTVGLRMPAHPVALKLIRLAGVPVAAPSANRFTELSPTTAAHVKASLGDRIECIVDGGPCEVGIESTVLSVAGGAPVLLRPGMISHEQLEAVLGRTVAIGGAVEGAHPSPGMHERHYAPRTTVYLVRNGQLPAGRGAYLYVDRRAEAEFAVAMPPDAVRYAQVLYEALHRADEARLEWIAVEAPPDGAEWSAVHDRLRRAATRE